MSKKFWVAASLIVLIAFMIPFEHKYDKLFRFFSLTLIPEGLNVSNAYEKKIYFYPSDLLTLCLFLLVPFRTSFRRYFSHPLWIVFICALGSIIASPFIHYPVAYIRLLQLFTPIALFSFLAFALAEGEKRKITKMVMLAIVTAGLCQCAIAIAQYFHGAPLGLRILGENNTVTTIPVLNGTRWTFDLLFQDATDPRSFMRAAGTFPHANVLGGFLMLSILCTYNLIMENGRKRLLCASLPLQFFAMCLTFSRSAIFSCLIATFIWLFLMRKEVKARLIAITMLLSVACSSALLYHQFVGRGGIVNYNVTAQNSDSVRIYHQNFALKVMQAKPWLGLGYNQFSERARELFPSDVKKEVLITAPHNIFLFLACETGLISLAAFLAFIGLILLSAIRSSFEAQTATLFSAILAFLFIGLCDFYPILFQQGKLMFFLVAGLLASHLFVKKIEIVVKQNTI